jgi:uncharacterized protein (DUF1697 family)
VFAATNANSGKAAQRIQEALERKLGVLAQVIVISGEDLALIVAINPLGKSVVNPSRMLVGVLEDPADKAKLTEIAKTDWGEEKISLKGAPRAVYMWLPRGVAESKLNLAVSKALGVGVTTRNWSTMLKLTEMMADAHRAE